MWVPNSIQISRELIQAELDRKIPAGTMLAVAAFSMHYATKETAKKILETFSLDRSAAKVAWKFLETGEVVTSDGEILSPSKVESPAKPSPNLPIDSSDSTIPSLVNKYFPDWPTPTSEQIKNITLLANNDTEVVDNALFQMANGNTDIRNPIVLLLYKLKNESAEKIAQDRAIIERKGRSGDSIIRETMRKADALIPTLPTPQATDANTEALRKLRGLVERGRAE